MVSYTHSCRPSAHPSIERHSREWPKSFDTVERQSERARESGSVCLSTKTANAMPSIEQSFSYPLPYKSSSKSTKPTVARSTGSTHTASECNQWIFHGIDKTNARRYENIRGNSLFLLRLARACWWLSMLKCRASAHHISNLFAIGLHVLTFNRLIGMKRFGVLMFVCHKWLIRIEV